MRFTGLPRQEGRGLWVPEQTQDSLQKIVLGAEIVERVASSFIWKLP